VNITVKAHPNQAPRITLLQPVEGVVLKGMVDISGMAWDDLRVDAVYIRIDDAPPISITGGENWSVFWDPRKVANGNHRRAVWVGDGSLQSPEASVNVTVGNPRPSGPGGINPLRGMAMLALLAVVVLISTIAVIAILMKRTNGPEILDVAAVEEMADEKMGPGSERGSGG
jgi:hypothetical protein